MQRETHAGNRQGIETGFGLMDLFGLLWRAKVWIIVLAALGALAGAGSSLILPMRWTATALVQIGQVGQPQGRERSADAGQVVEAPVRAVERIRDQPFVDAVLGDLGVPPGDVNNPDAALIRSTLRVNLRRGSDLIEIQVAGASREDARKHAEAFVTRLAATHARIAEPSVQRLRQQLQLIDSELAEANSVKKRLFDTATTLRAQVGAGEKFSESVLLGSLVAEQSETMRDLRDSKLKLEEQLSPNRTFPTSLLSAVHVPLRQTSPRLLPLALVGAIVGGGVGLLVGVRNRHA